MISHTPGPALRTRAVPDSKIVLVGAIPVFVLIVLLQWTGGAYHAEFGGHPDEAAHYVTGLMVRDYVAAGVPGNPLAFAQNYYDHYPKVALGNWPPGFYLIQTAWTLPFSPSRTSVLLLMAFLTCLVTLLVMYALVEDVGRLPAVLGGLLFVAFPLVQRHAAMVMTEIPVALFGFAAVLCFARYLERGRTIDSLLFALFASAAIMIKGSGLVLALVPPLTILFTGRFDVLTRRNFWYPVPIVAVLCGPWTWAFRDVARAGWEESSVSLAYTSQATVFFPRTIAADASLVIGVFALIGFFAILPAVRQGRASTRWAAAAALLVGVLVFQALVPASLDPRHVIPALPAWAMFAVAGVVFAARRVAAVRPRAGWVPYGLALAGLLHTGWLAPDKRCGGFGAVIEDVVAAEENATAVFLISSDATGEGMFIAETAMREKRPGHTIRRASKLLATQKWDGGDYEMTVENEADLMTLLEEERIKYVILDASIPPSLLTPHHELLRTAAANSPRNFALRGRYPLTRDYLVRPPGQTFPDGISVFQMHYAPAAP
jgi:hypothetical protein